MRVLIGVYDTNAHYYISLGLARAWATVAEVTLWDYNKKSAFDAFDTNNPDVFFGHSYRMKPDLVKVLKERPEIRRIIRVGDYGKFASEVKKRFPILIATEEELELMAEIKPCLLHNHYLQKDIDQTHEGWMEQGFEVTSLLSGADLYEYWQGKEREEYKCEVGYIGGLWGYKQQTIQPYIFPLLDKFHCKIFGNSNWGIPQYCGFLREGVADFFKSASVSVNISEPHSQIFGQDLVERPFKVMSSGGFLVSDAVRGLTELFPQCMIHSSGPGDMSEKIEFYLKNEDKRKEIAEAGCKEVVKNHSYHNRVEQILRKLGYEDMADRVAAIHKESFLKNV